MVSGEYKTQINIYDLLCIMEIVYSLVFFTDNTAVFEYQSRATLCALL